jgi:hypothetical protein
LIAIDQWSAVLLAGRSRHRHKRWYKMGGTKKRGPLVLCVAHRTPTSASRCLELANAGVRIFEIDVRLHGDDVVVSHFLPVLRIPGWLENDGTRVRFYRRKRRDRTALAAIANIPPDCAVVLDLKEDVRRRRQVLTEHLVWLRRDLERPDRLYVSTHNVDDLALLREAGFRTWRTVSSRRELERVVSLGRLPDDGVSIRHTLLSSQTVERLHESTERVIAWTVNEPSVAARLITWGVDGITTDEESVIRTVCG